MASKCLFGLILRLLPGRLGRRKYKPKRALWLQSACLVLFCGSFREVWREGNKSPNGHFGFKVLVWPYSAAPSGRFGEKEIKAQTGTLASKCLFGLILRLLRATGTLASKCLFGLILRLLPGRLRRRKYKLKRALWLQSACLALFCGSFGQVWGEGNISPNGHFGFKVLVWPYSAAPSGRFGEKEIKAQTGTLASKCLFGLILRLLQAGLGRRKYKPKRALWLQSACLALFCGSFREVWREGNKSPNGHFGFKVLVWTYSAAPSGRFGEKEIQAQKRALWLQSACLALFWAPSGRFGEKEI